MKTHVVTTILDDSISGDKIHGGDISALDSLESALLFVSGGVGSFIQATTIGGSTLSECAPIFANTIRSFIAMSVLSSVDSSVLFEAYESGPKTVRGNYYDNGVNFVKISKAFIEISPLLLRLMTTSAAPTGYTTRTGGNWYFDGTANLNVLIVRGASTIPIGTFGGLDIATMASRHSTLWAFYSSLSGDIIGGMPYWNGVVASSLVQLASAHVIDVANWEYLKTTDQHVSKSSSVEFAAVATPALSVNTGDGPHDVSKAIIAKHVHASSYFFPGDTTDLLFNIPRVFAMSYSIWYPLAFITLDAFYFTSQNTISGNKFKILLPPDLQCTNISLYQPVQLARIQCRVGPLSTRYTMLITLQDTTGGQCLICEIVNQTDELDASIAASQNIAVVKSIVLTLPLSFA